MLGRPAGHHTQKDTTMKKELKALWAITRFLIITSAAWFIIWTIYDAIQWAN